MSSSSSSSDSTNFLQRKNADQAGTLSRHRAQQYCSVLLQATGIWLRLAFSGAVDLLQTF
jgi:hypothetical protein